MKKIKCLKSMVLTTTLTLGISLFNIADAQAATYTIVKGDTLYKISQVFNTSVSNLMNDNNLVSTTINIGQELSVSSKTHLVQKGDTLYSLAKKYGVPLQTLRKANNIYTYYIRIGQILNIPIMNPSTTAPVSTTTPAPTIAPTTPTAPAAVINYSASELDLLARLIMAETQGEPYQAQLAVGAVVINRVQSGLFSNTISGVINQNINGYYQFSPVENGWINKPANDSCIRAAKEALTGVDPTNGALFYYDNTTTNAWILSKPVATNIGNMVYAYK